jgi:NTP pyrophosphatase (non-canonical NTP hydrolase)
LNVNWNEIIEKLKSKVNIILEDVIRITDTEIITNKSKYCYEEIVSTIPANIFWNLYYYNSYPELKSKSVTFAIVDEVPHILDGENFDLVYFIDDRYKYTRINRKDTKYLYEFTGELTEEQIKETLLSKSEIKQIFVDKLGIIYSNPNNIPPANIRFLGRFATWNHSIKINDVIKESKFSYDFRNIWERQRNFYNRVTPLSDFSSIDAKEKETHSILLHIQSELAEILNATNYKKHHKKKEVDVANIQEEIIDVFKFLLNMCILWNIDMRKFVEEFLNKSKIVEERFKKEMEK